MKSPFVVSTTPPTNVFILKNSCKENIENLNLIETGVNSNKIIQLANSNSTYEFLNKIEKKLTDNSKNICNNANNINDFQKLKRSHAIEDMQAMDDYSPVTYDASINSNVELILEDDKLVIQGIKVRAAKISKLIQILIHSFGKYF